MKKVFFPRIAGVLVSALIVFSGNSGRADEARAGVRADGQWVQTWTAAQQLTEPRNLPPPPGLSGNTLRQVVRISLGGSRLRLRFSNQFGDGPLTIRAAHIALAAGAGAIQSATDRAFTFHGQTSMTIPAGAETVSDAFEFPLKPLSE